MKKAQKDGLYLLLLGSAVFLFLGMALEYTEENSMADFKGLYYSARCLIQHSDPYNEGEFLRIFEADGGKFPQSPAIYDSYRRSVTAGINMPATLFLIVPFALLAWGQAHLLWLACIAASFILAAALMWNLGARYAPGISGGLIFLLLANSELLLITGNSAGIVVSFCVVAVWCLLQERLVFAGVLLLAVGLAMKPHDASLVWLYVLLAGGVHRKRALQTLVVAVVLSLPAVLWVSHVAPHWIPELESNLAASSARGGLNDPGPASTGGHGIGMVISLQAVLSFFRDDPRFYNPATYLICGVLLLVWLIATLRSRFTPAGAWFALAAIAPLSLLPVYHRSYDAKLLLLTVPACAMLWAEGGPIAWIALLINASGVALTGDITWAIILDIINFLSFPTTGVRAQMLLPVQIFPTPLILLTMSVFYLWVYIRRAHGPAPAKKGDPTENAALPA